MSKKIIVVGGVAGGATAIARLRRLDEDAEIILLEKGEFISFANCGLPYYIGDVIKNRDALFVSDIETIEGKYGVEIRNFSELIEVDTDEKKVLIKDIKNNKNYYESYDKLLLSTGSHPFVPDMEGKDNDNVFTLWNIPDTDKIYNYIENNSIKKAVVAGGGFIGIEMAENLSHRGIDVTLIEFADQVMAPLDKDMAKIVENHIVDKNIDLRLKTGLKAIKDQGKKVELSNGEILNTDMILLSIGVRPNTEFLKDSKIKLNEKGGVIVDSNMQTSVEDVYAVGDIIEIKNKISGLQTMIPLAGIANKQGRAVAANILGKKEEKFDGAIGTSVVKVFDLTIAATGENEKSLNKRGLKLWKDYGISLIHPMSHAGYYPGALQMSLKLIFSLKDGRVLGGQIAGYDGVDKRIDTIATSIHYKGSIYDLTKIELAYAPPFGSAKDPVNMAGYYATNIYEGLSQAITYEEYEENKEKYILLDVREKIEQTAGSIPNSINIPLTELRERYEELEKDKEYILYCAVGLRGYIGERILKQKGYKVKNLLGGYLTYKQLNQDNSIKDMGKENKKFENNTSKNNIKDIIELDVCGLSCPGPIVSVSKKMEELKEGEILQVKSTDPGFARDIESWCSNTCNTLEDKEEGKGYWTVNIRKGQGTENKLCEISSSSKEKTMIVFDGDLDRAIAAFIIANGSLAMGNKVNMFFTFWGLNILRKKEKVNVKKDFMGKMFGAMMPRGTGKLSLSKMNFGGMGSKMMRGIMKKKGISSLEELIEEAIENGVKIIACQMSMDVMGITKEELIDGVEVGGVATMLNDNDRSNMNLFI
ncbi:MAG: DsrE/DsrF/DrsH-like family protein [Peptoniphilaceae bacterium]